MRSFFHYFSFAFIMAVVTWLALGVSVIALVKTELKELCIRLWYWRPKLVILVYLLLAAPNQFSFFLGQAYIRCCFLYVRFLRSFCSFFYVRFNNARRHVAGPQGQQCLFSRQRSRMQEWRKPTRSWSRPTRSWRRGWPWRQPRERGRWTSCGDSCCEPFFEDEAKKFEKKVERKWERREWEVW